MKSTFLASTALLGLLTATAAGAQTIPATPGTTGGVNSGINSGINVVPNTNFGTVGPNNFGPVGPNNFGGVAPGTNFGLGTTFVPGAGFVTTDQFLQNNGVSAVSPGFYPGFYPGYTSGYFNPGGFYGGGYGPYGGYGYGPTYDTSGSFDSSQYLPRPRGMSSVVPTLGISAPPLRPGRNARIAGRRMGGVRQRVAGSRQELTGMEYVNQIKPQQVKLASRMEDVMDDRPITEGTVTDINGTGILVRYEVDGEPKIMRFTPGQVFFFHRNGDLATAAVEPGSVRTGSKVLIPIPINREPRQSVAGSRQEVRSESTYESGSKMDAQMGAPRSKVMGSRQSIRSRRPAK